MEATCCTDMILPPIYQRRYYIHVALPFPAVLGVSLDWAHNHFIEMIDAVVEAVIVEGL